MANHRHLRFDPRRIAKVRRQDLIAKGVISTGGIAVIVAVVGIMLLIVSVTAPLFKSPQSQIQFAQALPAETVERGPIGINIEEYTENAFVLNQDGSVDLFKLTEGGLVHRRTETLRADDTIAQATKTGRNQWSILWASGMSSLVRLYVVPDFAEDGTRTINAQVETLAEMPLTSEEMPQYTFLRKSEDATIRIDILEQGRVIFTSKPESGGGDPLFGGSEETDPVRTEVELTLAGTITAAAASTLGNQVYIGSSEGDLVWLRFDSEATLTDHLLERRLRDSGITSLGFVFGDVSIIVADQTGNLLALFPYRDEQGFSLKHFATLDPQQAAVTDIGNSSRNKMVISRNEKGEIHLDYLTSRKRIFTLATEGGLTDFGYSPRGDGLLALHTDTKQVSFWRLKAPHPETSWSTLFAEVWYENYPQPEYVWQSTGGSDDFEPKMSLVPLIFGTIKATFYAMLFALPLGIFGAVYLSHFASARFRSFVKPSIELMAALPSVVIGFLVALWLAPMFESAIVGVFATIVFVPIFFLVFMLVWQTVRHQPWAKKIERGYEFIVLLPVTALAVALAFYLTPYLEHWLFQGDFTQWLYTTNGTRFDQRNSIVIAVGLGIAVIPIIFSISEDSLSSVPRELSSSSLALGASRWQTVWRVIIPSASPGIFAATMIGLGRAVGETMIVLMATGNTPIMDWSLFNGMRTLSANIAVEVPEAPVGGTLYRTLFLCSVILFIMTFFLNTAAELVRHKLRKKYGRF